MYFSSSETFINFPLILKNIKLTSHLATTLLNISYT